jgi:hypothetical protein
MQDPFERADITSNTFWDWQLNHVGSIYGAMDEVFVRSDTEGVSTALVPTELCADSSRGRDAGVYQESRGDRTSAAVMRLVSNELSEAGELCSRSVGRGVA